MNKAAAIDIGTNSVLYSLFEIRQGSRLRDVHFERHSPRIGGKLKGQKKPRISEDNYRKLRAILRRHINHARKNGAADILIAATNPFRLAENGPEIKRRLDGDLGYPTTILSANREAYLSFIGAVGRLRKDQMAVVIDLGGGSTELVVYRGEKRLAFVSLPEGAVSLTERFNSSGEVDPDDFPGFEQDLAGYRKRLTKIRPYLKSGVTLVGGTSSALAFMKDRRILETGRKVILTAEDLSLFVRLLAGLNLPCRRRLLKLDKKRAEIIFAGAFWLDYLFKGLRLTRAEATPCGLRHGLVVERLTR